MTDSVEHSPLPINIESGKGKLVINGPYDIPEDLFIRWWDDEENEGYDVCNLACDETRRAAANAALIVRACNSHEALVGALEPFAEQLSESDAREGGDLAIPIWFTAETLLKAIDALALAKGGCQADREAGR